MGIYLIFAMEVKNWANRWGGGWGHAGGKNNSWVAHEIILARNLLC